jgi:hypothetical protein
MSPTTTSRPDRLQQVFVPTVIEEGNRGDRAFDIYSQLLRERIVFLGQEVDDQVANLIASNPDDGQSTSTEVESAPDDDTDDSALTARRPDDSSEGARRHPVVFPGFKEMAERRS